MCVCLCVYAAVYDVIPVDVIGDIIKLECQRSEEQHQTSNYSSKYVDLKEPPVWTLRAALPARHKVCQTNWKNKLTGGL